ncbi:MFS transporter [Alkalihalobacillus sp. AL-G]|uniref:MFS transporter n=1 Tax=Alkalihalobacillus sp. AL-G TaxID=2926399 RepID=UPI00272ADFE4|nr:MFS transporter [Alkalihalobacillus sp. AL-G]WLD93706.1 MFS transporter [Alkalihalobacillus sp. AL-G]
MKQLKRSIKGNIITLTSLLFMLGIIGTRPLVSLYSYELNASPLQIGIIIALFPLLPLVLAIRLGKMVDKFGYRIPLIFSTLFGSVAIMIPMFMPNLIGVYLSQIIAGITQTIFAVSAQSFIGSFTDESESDRQLMRFSIGVAIGSFLGPLLSGIISDEWGYPAAFGISGCIAILGGVVALLLAENKEHSASGVRSASGLQSSFSLLKISNIKKAILISVLVLLGKDIFIAYFPLLALEYGFSSTVIGIVISINAAAGILIRWSMPYLIRRFTRNIVVIGSIVCSGLCFIAISFFGNSVILIILSFLLGMGLGIGQPLSISTTMHALPRNRIGEGLGLRLTANRFTQLSGPVILGMIAEFTNISTIFLIIGIFILTGATKTKISSKESHQASTT